ncbi:hypothetical protein MRX96_058190 [Rhipicephalus microplus]
MWNDGISTLMHSIGTPGLPCSSRKPRYHCHGSSCGFSSSVLQPGIFFPQASLGESGPTLAYITAKYPSLNVPLMTFSDLTFEVQGFKTGVKSISVDEQKQRKFLDHKTKAVEPVFMQTIPTNDLRCALTEVSHRWARPVSPVSAHVSQLNDTQMQTWASRTIETDATSHTGPLANRVAHVQPASPTASTYRGRPGIYWIFQGSPSLQHCAISCQH